MHALSDFATVPEKKKKTYDMAFTNKVTTSNTTIVIVVVVVCINIYSLLFVCCVFVVSDSMYCFVDCTSVWQW